MSVPFTIQLDWQTVREDQEESLKVATVLALVKQSHSNDLFIADIHTGAVQGLIAQQYAAAATMQQQQQQQQPSAQAALRPDAMAGEHAGFTASSSNSVSFPPLSPADVGAWWLDDSTLHCMAKFNQLDEPLVLTVDAEPVTLSFDEVSALKRERKCDSPVGAVVIVIEADVCGSC
jgi:hypothetical protein